jgi:hypothetical protein
MIIVTEKKTSDSIRINEAQELPVLRFETFIEDITSGKFHPNHIEIFPKTSTRFHVAFRGKINVSAKTNFVDFSANGSALTVISIGENDIDRMYRSSDPEHPYFRMVMKNGMLFFVSQI